MKKMTYLSGQKNVPTLSDTGFEHFRSLHFKKVCGDHTFVQIGLNGLWVHYLGSCNAQAILKIQIISDDPLGCGDGHMPFHKTSMIFQSSKVSGCLQNAKPKKHKSL